MAQVIYQWTVTLDDCSCEECTVRRMLEPLKFKRDISLRLVEVACKQFAVEMQAARDGLGEPIWIPAPPSQAAVVLALAVQGLVQPESSTEASTKEAHL